MKKLKNKWILSLTPLLLLPIRSVADAKPNIVLILADDMGYGDVGFNGCKDIPTPNIDSIAANGVRFSNGYVTAPQCAPSRAGLLSGIVQSRFGREKNHSIDVKGVPSTIKQFGDYMREAGYRTGMVGKWHQGTMEGHHPLDRGFDWFFGFLVGSSHYFPEADQESIPRLLENREPQKVVEYLTFVFGDRAVDFIQQKSDKPFFLYLAFNAPHSPLQAPKDYLKKFEHLAVAGERGVRCAYTKKMIAHPRQIYAAMVSALDDTIGKVLQALRESGQENNTLIYFLSDNGGPTYETLADNGPLRGVKGDLLEGGIRVPFAVQWKGTIPGGRTIDTPVLSLDLLPTSLVAAGAPVPGLFDGVNLLPLLVDGKELEPRTLYWRFPFPSDRPVWSIRQGEWKLVHERPQPKPVKAGITGLYRLSDDIHEDHDLSAQYPEVRQQLQAKYDKWAAELPKTEADKK